MFSSVADLYFIIKKNQELVQDLKVEKQNNRDLIENLKEERSHLQAEVEKLTEKVKALVEYPDLYKPNDVNLTSK